MKSAAKEFVVIPAIVTMVALIIPQSAGSCSYIDLASSKASALRLTGEYWIGTIFLGLALVGIEAYYRTWSLLLAAALTIFHPRWIVPAYYAGPDCEFLNVQASQVIIVVIAIIVAYRIVRVFRSRAG